MTHATNDNFRLRKSGKWHSAFYIYFFNFLLLLFFLHLLHPIVKLYQSNQAKKLTFPERYVLLFWQKLNHAILKDEYLISIDKFANIWLLIKTVDMHILSNLCAIGQFWTTFEVPFLQGCSNQNIKECRTL